MWEIEREVEDLFKGGLTGVLTRGSDGGFGFPDRYHCELIESRV